MIWLIVAFIAGAGVAIAPCVITIRTLLDDVMLKDVRISDLEAKTMSHTLDGYGYLASISSAGLSPAPPEPQMEEEYEEFTFNIDSPSM